MQFVLPTFFLLVIQCTADTAEQVAAEWGGKLRVDPVLVGLVETFVSKIPCERMWGCPVVEPPPAKYSNFLWDYGKPDLNHLPSGYEKVNVLGYAENSEGAGAYALAFAPVSYELNNTELLNKLNLLFGGGNLQLLPDYNKIAQQVTSFWINSKTFVGNITCPSETKCLVDYTCVIAENSDKAALGLKDTLKDATHVGFNMDDGNRVCAVYAYPWKETVTKDSIVKMLKTRVARISPRCRGGAYVATDDEDIQKPIDDFLYGTSTADPDSFCLRPNPQCLQSCYAHVRGIDQLSSATGMLGCGGNTVGISVKDTRVCIQVYRTIR